MENYLKIHTTSDLSLIATVLALLLFSLFIAVAVSLVTTGASIGLQEEQGVQAFYIAEGGSEWGLRKLNEVTKCGDLITYTSENLGNGSFSLQWTTLYRPIPSARLSAGIGAGDISITVNNVDVNGDGNPDYAPSGRITISTPPNSETIDYTSIVGNTFTGCIRGVDGTTAIAHNANDRVVQNQCDIISTGTISSNPLASVQRQVRVSAQP